MCGVLAAGWREIVGSVRQQWTRIPPSAGWWYHLLFWVVCCKGRSAHCNDIIVLPGNDTPLIYCTKPVSCLAMDGFPLLVPAEPPLTFADRWPAGPFAQPSSRSFMQTSCETGAANRYYVWSHRPRCRRHDYNQRRQRCTIAEIYRSRHTGRVRSSFVDQQSIH